MKLTRLLTNKLTSFWLFSLAAVAFIFLLTALISFAQLTSTFQQQKVTELEAMLVHHFDHDGTSVVLDSWLPPILSAYNVTHLVLKDGNKTLYEYSSGKASSGFVYYEKLLSPHKGLNLSMKLPQPFKMYRFSWYALIVFLTGTVVIILFVRSGYLWLSTQLEGIEDLAVRSKLILNNEYERALAEKGQGKPRMINRALTHMLLELDDAQKQRARFDQFIRSNTFLDPETGIGNRLFLKNRLDALSNDSGMMAPGVLFLLEMEDLDLLLQEVGDELIDEILLQTIHDINHILDSQANSIFSRRSYNQFAIVVPQISLKDVEKLAAKLLKVCLNHQLPDGVSSDDFYHIGAAYFKVGETKEQLIDEAERALRAAQFQGNSGWFMYDKGAVDEEFAKGSVRWRSFLEYALVNRRLVIFSQPVVDSDMETHHLEISSRIRDNQNNLIRATLYIPMAIKCGLTPQFERQVIEAVLFDLLGNSNDTTTKYSVNLSLDTLMSRAFIRWLKTTLLEYRHLTPRFIFEINEDIVIHHTEQLASRLDMIRKMGASLCVDRVGQQVVSTQYIKEYHFDFIKLHRSIVRQIHLRQENQLFVRSLIGGLYRTGVQVFAEGVESFEEWQTLKILGVSAGQGSFFSDPIEEV
ncbi:RNase E specificity factor CsrD [Shewanella sp. D64]|uniref:RNase E specificity factor CsrD n=1 Tax=unclassified Shewanella TaxID=196818 RepID=UPI0022BA2C20|nr:MULTISPECIES: RNase E specificity factor CsrD [unclassified Shewanella]MEC4725435.1 RNase E specificity factor CsrD [Shewanella sp. D64]MEC4738748.1 RNase E specificity factor CsrD [Shewanella sp. E94]WBJ95039.1 RNase E specificity factor CsrD [Shewanella sp. MTB7]